MGLTEEIAKSTHSLTLNVYVAGIILEGYGSSPGISSLTISKSLDSAVPVCTMTLDHMPNYASFVRGASVTVDIGYNGLTERVFTGYLQDRSYGVESCTIHCLGMLWSAFRTVEIPERDVTGDTVEEAIEDVLKDVGITNYSISSMTWELGTIEDAKLERMPASQMLQMLMDLECGRVYELGTGTVVIKPIEELPAPTTFKTFTTTTAATARVLEYSDHEDPDYIRTRMIVTGATIVEGTAPDTTSRTISQTATLISSPLVQPPLPAGTYIDMEYSNSLIDTDDKAVELAGKLLTRYARIPRTLTIEIAGDPQIELCQTLGFSIGLPNYALRWFVTGVEHEVGESGYVTRVTLRGGDELGGTVGINPIASFTYSVEREVISTAVYTFVTFDASTSFDPDGHIDTYAWSDDQSTTPEIATKTTAVATVRADTSGWSGDWNVILTVTDNDGLTGTLTLAIPYEAGASEIVIPAIYAAVNNNASATADGGQVWNKQAGSTCVSVGTKWPDGVHSGYACYGYTDGSIKRTIDFCASALTTELAAAGANGIINDINWDINAASRVWAVTSTGRVLRSDDDGDTWTVYKDFGNTYPLNRVSTPSAGGLWVFGGRGDVATTLIQYDALLDGNWHSVSIGGELATDLVGASSSITIAEATSTKWGELAVIFKGAALANDVAIFYTANVHGDGSDWLRATGLDASLVEGRYIVGDGFLPSYLYAAFNNRDTWATVDGVAWTKTANVLPANCVPWHAYYIGWMMPPGLNVHLISVENTSDTSSGIYKTADGFLTAQVLWPATGFTAWPASAKGKMAKVGAPGLVSGGSVLIAALLHTSTHKFAAWRTGLVNWTTKVFDADELGAGTGGERVRALTSNLWFILSNANYCNANNRIVRTKNGGATWDSVTTPKAGNDYWIDFSIDAGGRVWGATTDIVTSGGVIKIWYSDDQGDTWTLSKTITGTETYPLAAETIACHPSNQNVIAVRCARGINRNVPYIAYTLDRGDSWGVNYTSDISVYSVFPADTGFKVCDNNRLIVWCFDTSSSRIAISDDWGGNWTYRHNFAGAGSDRVLGAANPSGNKAFAFTIDEHEVWWAQDYGVTWAKFDNQPSMNEESGIAYDAVDDALYVISDDDKTTNISLVSKMSPVTQDGTWVDFSDTLLPIGADTHYLAKWCDQIAVIPR